MSPSAPPRVYETETKAESSMTRNFSHAEIMKALEDELWAQWDWIKLNVLSQINTLLTDIKTRLEATEPYLVEHKGLRWAYDVVCGFNKSVNITFEGLTYQLFRLLAIGDSIGKRAIYLLQGQTWLDIIESLRHRVVRIQAKAATSLSYQDYAAVCAGVPLDVSTLKSWKFELRFQRYTDRALASLKSSLLREHLSQKQAMLADMEQRQQQQKQQRLRSAARWLVTRSQYIRRMPDATAAIDRYLTSLSFRPAISVKYDLFFRDERRQRTDEIIHIIGYMKRYSATMFSFFADNCDAIMQLEIDMGSTVEKEWLAAVRRLLYGVPAVEREIDSPRKSRRLQKFIIKIRAEWQTIAQTTGMQLSDVLNI